MTQPEDSTQNENLVTKRAQSDRLHWAARCAILIVMVPLVLIMVPGELTWLPENASTNWERSLQSLRSKTENQILSRPLGTLDQVHLYEHGWPLPYMARSVSRDGLPAQFGLFGEDYKSIEWTYADSWPFYADKRIVRWGALAIDLAVGLVILMIVAAAINWRIRAGTGRWRFRILDAFLIIAVLALFLAPFAYHAHVQRVEAPVLGLVLKENGIKGNFDYHGPIWLRKLVGNKVFLRSMFHVDTITIDPSDNWREEFAQLEKCPYLTTVYLEHWLPLNAIPMLQRNRNIKHLGLPNLQIADMLQKDQGDSNEPFHVEHLARLEPLKLRSVSMSGPGYQAKHVRQIAALPTIQSIQLFRTQVTRDELVLLRRDFPDVAFTFTSDEDSAKPTLWTKPRINLPIKLPDIP